MTQEQLAEYPPSINPKLIALAKAFDKVKAELNRAIEAERTKVRQSTPSSILPRNSARSLPQI